ncbi:MAG: response regulator [bacterium]
MKRILVAEDDSHFRRALLETLYQEGYLTFTVEDGARALENLKIYKPHLLILDLKMPKIDGIELLKRIRTEQYSVPVMIVTAYKELAKDPEVAMGNIVTLMVKPIDLNVLKNKVNEMLKEVKEVKIK